MLHMRQQSVVKTTACVTSQLLLLLLFRNKQDNFIEHIDKSKLDADQSIVVGAGGLELLDL